MKKTILSVIILAAIMSTTSCVTKKKYVEMEDLYLSSVAENKKLSSQLKNTSESLVDCESNNSYLSSQVASLNNMKKDLQAKVDNYEQLINSNLSENDKLSQALRQKEAEINSKAATIAELEKMIKDQEQKVQDLLNNVEKALLGFDSEELTVTKKNGKVYVALSDKLLFQSGRANVDSRGKEALGKLAEVLNKQNDIDILIEGHTDSQPISTAQFKDNWDLSVIRATSVVRILTKDYKVNPLQIQPIGRAEFVPVADNETKEGRSKNRRTEIILAPRLDKLLEMLQK